MSIDGRLISGTSDGNMMFNAVLESSITAGHENRFVVFNPSTTTFELIDELDIKLIESNLVGLLKNFISEGLGDLQLKGNTTYPSALQGSTLFLNATGGIVTSPPATGPLVRVGVSTFNGTFVIDVVIFEKREVLKDSYDTLGNLTAIDASQYQAAYALVSNPNIPTDDGVYQSKEGDPGVWAWECVMGSGHATKITSATESNLAGFDETGNIKDSGSKAADFEPAITKGDAFNKNFGTSSGDVAEGSHLHTDLASKAWVDTVTSGLGNGILPPVADQAALELQSVTSNEDDYIINTDGLGLYRYQHGDATAPSGTLVLASLGGTGRWFKMSTPLSAHDALTDVLGGEYHLTSNELDEATTEFSEDTKGLVPGASAAEISALKVLQANGEWVVQTSDYAHPTGDGKGHVPIVSTTNNGRILTAGNAAGEYSWQDAPSGLPALVESDQGKVVGVNGSSDGYELKALSYEAADETILKQADLEGTGESLKASRSTHEHDTAYDASGAGTAAAAAAKTAHEAAFIHADIASNTTDRHGVNDPNSSHWSKTELLADDTNPDIIDWSHIKNAPAFGSDSVLDPVADNAAMDALLGMSIGDMVLVQNDVGSGKAAQYYYNNLATWVKIADVDWDTMTDDQVKEAYERNTDTEALTTDNKAILDATGFTPDTGSGGAKGLVPLPAAGDAAKVLSGAGTWVANESYTHPTGEGNKHIPADGGTSDGKVLTATGVAGVYAWETPAAGGGGGITLNTVIKNTSVTASYSISDGETLVLVHNSSGGCTVPLPAIGDGNTTLTIKTLKSPPYSGAIGLVSVSRDGTDGLYEDELDKTSSGIVVALGQALTLVSVNDTLNSLKYWVAV